LLRVYLKESTTRVTDAVVGRPLPARLWLGRAQQRSRWNACQALTAAFAQERMSSAHSHSSAHLAGGSPKISSKLKVHQNLGARCGSCGWKPLWGKKLNRGGGIIMTPVILVRLRIALSYHGRTLLHQIHTFTQTFRHLIRRLAPSCTSLYLPT